MPKNRHRNFLRQENKSVPFSMLREDKYKKWMEETVPDGEWELIRQVVQRGQLTGSNRFIEEVSKRTGKRIKFRGQGRPKSWDK